MSAQIVMDISITPNDKFNIDLKKKKNSKIYIK